MDNELTTEEFSKFMTALNGQDELGLIVRAHILIENQIEHFLHSNLANANELGNINYALKVKIALASGLRADLKAPLRAVGTLRNKFAHETEKALTRSDADEIYRSFGPRERAGLSYALKTARPDQINFFENSDPKEKIQIYLMVIWSALALMRVNWED